MASPRPFNGRVTVAERTEAVRRPVSGLFRHAWSIPLAVFALSRVVDGVLIAVASHDQVARDPDVAMVDTPAGADPGYLTALSNWDGQWFSQIAHDGYPTELPRVEGHVEQNAWAFYPLYPGLSRLLMTLFHLPFEVAASAVSLLAGAAAMVLVFRMVERAGGRFNATTTVAAVCLFPAAPVLQAAYAESLSLLLIVLCLTLLRARRFGWLVVATLLLAFCRPIVLPLAAVIGLHGLLRWRRRHTEAMPRREVWGYVGTASFAIVSFAFWPVVCGLVTGEADAFMLTEKAWMLDEQDGWPSWLASALDSEGRAFAVVGILACALVFAMAWRRAGRAWGTELQLWGPIYFLYLIGSTRPTTSILRYVMLTVVPAWPALEEPHHVPSRRTQVAVLTTMTVVGVALQYLWLRWFFVPHPGNHGFP